MNNTIAIETAYNVTVDYRLATVWDRIWAYVIDIIIKIVYSSIVVTIAFQVGFESYLLYTVLALPFLFYSLIFESINNGKTPGKSAMQIQVVSLDGKNLSFGQLLIRWIMRILDLWIFSFSIAFLAVVSTKKAQRLGDLVANTTVISLKELTNINKTSRVRLPDYFKGKYKQVLALQDTEIELLKSIIRDKSESAYNVQVAAAKHLQELLDLPKVETQISTSRDYLKLIVYEYNYHQMVNEGLLTEEE